MWTWATSCACGPRQFKGKCSQPLPACLLPQLRCTTGKRGNWATCNRQLATDHINANALHAAFLRCCSGAIFHLIPSSYFIMPHSQPQSTVSSSCSLVYFHFHCFSLGFSLLRLRLLLPLPLLLFLWYQFCDMTNCVCILIFNACEFRWRRTGSLHKAAGVDRGSGGETGVEAEYSRFDFGEQ